MHPQFVSLCLPKICLSMMRMIGVKDLRGTSYGLLKEKDLLYLIESTTLSYKLNRSRLGKIGLEGSTRGGMEEFLLRHLQSYGESPEVKLLRKAVGATG